MDLQRNPHHITEKEFRLFMRPRRRAPFIVVLAYTLGVMAVVGGTFFALNADAFLRAQPNAIQPLAPESASPTAVPAVDNQLPSTPAPAATPEQSAGVNLPDNTLSYTNLAISVPVHWDVAFKDQEINKNLETGIVHLDGTPHPGQEGLSVLFGHSSYYPWAKGNYKTVFAPLLNGKVGDTFDLSYQNTTYTYKVVKTYEVKAEELSILNSSTNLRGVRLVTCTPLGTSLRRFVVEANQISPDPSKNTAFNQKSFTGSLPGDQ
jgi:LPXTG-site transpeptidase (sortase) family protein